MLSLKTCLEQLATWKESITATVDGKVNTYYTATGSVAIAKTKRGTACTLTSLPVGTYLVLGNVVSTTDLGTSVAQLAQVRASTNTTLILSPPFRSSTGGGGGTGAWGIMKVTKNPGTVTLLTYGYGSYSGTNTYYGYLTAVKLI